MWRTPHIAHFNGLICELLCNVWDLIFSDHDDDDVVVEGDEYHNVHGDGIVMVAMWNLSLYGDVGGGGDDVVSHATEN